MKKLTFLVILGLSIALLSACGGDDSEDNMPSNLGDEKFMEFRLDGTLYTIDTSQNILISSIPQDDHTFLSTSGKVVNGSGNRLNVTIGLAFEGTAAGTFQLSGSYIKNEGGFQNGGDISFSDGNIFTDSYEPTNMTLVVESTTGVRLGVTKATFSGSVRDTQTDEVHQITDGIIITSASL